MKTPEERLAVLETEMASVQKALNEMGGDVRTIRDTLLHARGGWKTLMLVAGAAGALGTFLTKIVISLPLK